MNKGGNLCRVMISCSCNFACFQIRCFCENMAWKWCYKIRSEKSLILFTVSGN